MYFQSNSQFIFNKLGKLISIPIFNGQIKHHNKIYMQDIFLSGCGEQLFLIDKTFFFEQLLWKNKTLYIPMVLHQFIKD